MAIATTAPLVLSGTVGRNAANRPGDVAAVQAKLAAIRQTSTREGIPLHGVSYVPRVSRGPVPFAPELAGAPNRGPGAGSQSQLGLVETLDETTVEWIRQFQSLFLRMPDGVIQPGGVTAKLLSGWSISPIDTGVNWQGELKTAWLMVSPLLPPNSRCTSAYRSAEEQKQIIDRMFLTTYVLELKVKLAARYTAIVAMTGDARYAAMVTELRGIGQAVALPGRSPHQRGKAFDIGGPDDAEQVKLCKMVAGANARLFSGKILKERNGCVHVEIN
jgi:hypothetical protein